MKRFLVFISAIMITVFILAGCSIPFFGNSSDDPPADGHDHTMISLDDSLGSNQSDDAGTAGASDAGDPGNGAGAADVPDAGDPGNGAGAADVPDAGDPGNKTGVAGTAYGDDSKNTARSDGEDDAVGAVNPAGGVLDTDPIDSLYVNEDDPEEGYIADHGDENKETPDKGVLAAQSSLTSGSFAQPRRPVTVYYQDMDGCLIPMTRWIQPQLGIARAAVSLSIDGPVAREETAYYGVYPVLPESTEILGIDIREGTAVIDFNRYLLNYGTAYSERNIIASVVYTLTEFDTIEKVKILINGYPQGVLKYGTDLSEALDREDIMINTDPGLVSKGKGKLDVYYMKQANAGFCYPVPISLTSDEYITDITPKLLITHLLANEPDGGIFSDLPDGVYLIGSYEQNSVVTLDFSEEFLSYGGTQREEDILMQLVYTLRQCEEIKKINITVEGRRVELPEGTDISAGLVIPVTVNDVIDR